MTRSIKAKDEELFARIVCHLRGGAKILLCGNGGSAAIAQHIAAELMVKYVKVRKPIPAIALSTDTSVLTACANDFGYDQIFKRQIDALCLAGDIVILMSTSGSSENILKAAEAARDVGAYTIAMTGSMGLYYKNKNTAPPLHDAVRSNTLITAEIQEAHFHWLHELCEYLDEHG